MPKLAVRLLVVSLALLAGFFVEAADAPEIKVLCAGAMRAVLQQLAPAFEKICGDAGL